MKINYQTDERKGKNKKCPALKGRASSENVLLLVNASTLIVAHLRHHSFKEHQSGGKSVLVNTTTLTKLISKFPLVDLVKVDVEGAEWEVLEGADQAVPKIKRWLVELHDIQRRGELEQWFRKHDYTIRWIDDLHLFAWKEE